MTDNDETAPVVRELPDIIGSAAGAAFGLTVAGPAGAITGAATGPALAAALRYGADALHARRHRAARAMQLAADRLNLTPDQLGQHAAADPARLELLARVLEAAGRTPLEQKIPALARVLADGLSHDHDATEALLLAAALDGIEAPHVLVMRQVAGPNYTPGEAVRRKAGGQMHGHVTAALHSQVNHVEAVLNALQGLGVVEDVSTPHTRPTPQTALTRSTTRAEPLWRLTRLGRLCLDLLLP